MKKFILIIFAVLFSASVFSQKKVFKSAWFKDTVGIGVENPTYKFQVAGGDAQIKHTDFYLENSAKAIAGSTTFSGAYALSGTKLIMAGVTINSDGDTLFTARYRTDADNETYLTVKEDTVRYYVQENAIIVNENEMTSDYQKMVARNYNLSDSARIYLDTSGTNIYGDLEVVGNTYVHDFVGIGIATPNNRLQVLNLLDFSGGTEGTNYTHIGHLAGENSTGFRNTFVGEFAGQNTTGNSNVFVGQHSGMENTSGEYNTYLGNSTGRTVTTGSYNTMFGYHAGFELGTVSNGSRNCFIGYRSGYKNETGIENTFLGYYSGGDNSTGSYNTFAGVVAMRGNTTGVCNTAFGYGAGRLNITGDSCVFLGYKAGYNETGSNKLYIANSDTSNPLIYGEFDNDYLKINGELEVTDTVKFSTVEETNTFDGVMVIENNVVKQNVPADITMGAGNIGSTIMRYDTTNTSYTNTSIIFDNDDSTVVVDDGLNITGANYRHRTASATDYNPSALTQDYIIAITSTGTDRAVTISSEDVATGTPTNPRMFIIKDEGGGATANNITITLESGGTIDGGASTLISVNYNSISLYVDGTNAWIY